MDNVVLLCSVGMTETEVVNLPMDLFESYVRSAQRRQVTREKVEFSNMVVAISGCLSGKGIKEHVKHLDATFDESREIVGPP